MRYGAPAWLLAAALAACAPGGQPAAAPFTTVEGLLSFETTARIDSILAEVTGSGGVPGASVAIARGNQLAFARGYGMADLERVVPTRPDMLFRIGSVTKQFTAAAVLRLAEQGRLTLDDPVKRFIPEYQAQGDVTLRQLLNHTSGIRSYTTMPQWRTQGHLPLTTGEMLEILAVVPPEFEAGEMATYSNSGYFLLGIVIERVTGQDYATHLRQELLEPLGLDNIVYCPDEPVAGHARGHSFAGAPARRISMSWPFAAGALCASTPDLVRWKHALVTGDVIGADQYAAMIQHDTLPDGQINRYGFGLVRDEWKGHERISHGGAISGYSAYLAHFPDQDLTIAVLQNTDDESSQRTANHIAELVLDAIARARSP